MTINKKETNEFACMLFFIQRTVTHKQWNTTKQKGEKQRSASKQIKR